MQNADPLPALSTQIHPKLQLVDAAWPICDCLVFLSFFFLFSFLLICNYKLHVSIKCECECDTHTHFLGISIS